MRLHKLMLALLGTVGVCAWQVAAAQAADLMVTPPGTIVQDTALPAVSGFNGKWEFDPGIITGTGGVRAAGSLSAPLGDRFGVQGDGILTWSSGHGLVGGGALHAFTRDPSSYLAGVTAGVVVSSNATLAALGAEGELYLDRWSLEGWAGVAGLDFVDPALVDKVGGFAIGDIAYYPTDDFRVSLGGSYLLGDLSLHTAAEYQFSGAPLSVVGDARLHDNGALTFTVGLKGSFGGKNDKSLIDRQRQDDPPNRALDLFTSAGSQIYQTAPMSAPPPEPTPEDQCLATSGNFWIPFTPGDEFNGECVTD